MNDLSFLSMVEASAHYDKVLEHSSRAKETMPGFKVLGNPFYVNALEKSPRSVERVSSHNEFMKKNFGELLDRTVKQLSEVFKKEVFLDPEISWPGFHLITIEGKSNFTGPFHFDNEFNWIQHQFPRYSDVTEHGASFTVLLSPDKDLESGLFYLPENHPLSASVDKFPLAKIRAMADFHQYETGRLNFHRQLLHAISGKNHSDKKLVRVTFQGHLVETGGKLLLYW
ncbi:MAG: hypothetical protein ACJ76H_09000 [Bacteriovoracaceae bacterium]